MRRAISLALKAQFQTEPNPMVGAVLVDQTGKTLSEGYHHKAGAPHAEVEALKPFSKVPEGAILFVTLEPCNFHGKTPPCTDLIIEKHVQRVVVGCKDPNPKVAGKGIEKLKNHDIEVIEGISEEACRNINRVFNKHIVEQLPFVTIKTAMSLDGKISMASGESQWITCQEARNDGQRLRSQHLAMAVGHKTLIADNPRLTDRISEFPRQPSRVVFSSKGDIPMDSHFARQSETKRIVVAGALLPNKTKKLLTNAGIHLIIDKAEKPGIRTALLELYKLGICSLLVEGGAELIASFIKEKMVDQFQLYIAGKIIGDKDAPAWCGDSGTEKLAEVLTLDFDRMEKIGTDLLITGYPK